MTKNKFHFSAYGSIGVELSGQFVAVRGNSPCIVRLGDLPKNYCPVFANIKQLTKWWADVGGEFDGIYEIKDGPAFLAAAPREVTIIFDLGHDPKTNIHSFSAMLLN